MELNIEQTANFLIRIIPVRAFISYSHSDDEALNRLHVHLANLRRDGHIKEWYDRNILAGGTIDDEVNRELETADLFLLLVSPDFLASNYCVEREMQRALERHEAGEARVVPIIVEPCDWVSMQALRSLKAVPTDGKPISEWTNRNTAYLNVVQEIRRIIEAESANTPASEPTPTVTSSGAPRYRIQRDFDEIDQSEFREAAFATIKNYFCRATAEIDTTDGLRGRFVDRGPNSFGCTVINRGRQRGTTHITVHCGGARTALGDILYSFTENAPDNTANGALEISSDEYEQYLVVGMAMRGDEPGRLTPEQSAEYLWNQFIERAGVRHA